jgi:hypothetical protein
MRGERYQRVGRTCLEAQRPKPRRNIGNLPAGYVVNLHGDLPNAGGRLRVKGLQNVILGALTVHFQQVHGLQAKVVQDGSERPHLHGLGQRLAGGAAIDGGV